MSRKYPKTDGLEWLALSLASFNGSGYADMYSPEDFLESYIAYNLWRKRPQGVRMVQIFRDEALNMIRHLLRTTYGAGRIPSQQSLAKFQAFRKQHQSQLF